jgi:hypothetical protein
MLGGGGGEREAGGMYLSNSVPLDVRLIAVMP